MTVMETDSGKTAVPKFSSFRAKPAPAEDKTAASTTTRSAISHPDHRPAKRLRSLSPEDRRHAQPHRPRHSKQHTKDIRDEPRVRRDRDDYNTSSKQYRRDGDHARVRLPPSDPSTTDEKSDLFTKDIKGDPQNIVYGRLHRYSIPAYRRAGYGCIVGLKRNQRIEAEGSTEHRVAVLDSRDSQRARQERVLLKRQKHGALPELRVTHIDLEPSAPGEDYIPLRRHAATTHSSDTSDREENDLGHFKHIETTPKTQERPTDPDLDYVQPEEDSSSFAADVQARQRNTELFRLTKQDPTTLSPWLDLITHQERLVRPGASSTDLSNIERRTLADIRISIYEKALKCIPTDQDVAYEQLLFGMLEEASVVWDAQKYLQRLGEILQDHSASFLLWTKYLDAAQTNPIKFRFEDSKSFFLRCLQNMKPPSSSSPNPEIAADYQSVQLYILLRYTTFLRQAGYEELAIANWQALIEFHIFRPHSLTEAGDNAALTAFEQFWESEAPRFGENHSRGWLNYGETDVVPLSSELIPENNELAKDYPFRSFAGLEQASMKKLRFPGKTMEEAGSDDPFHLIFYSDIKDVLEATCSLSSSGMLIDAFLVYMGLPELPTDLSLTSHNSRTSLWRSDVFLADGLLGDHPSVTYDGSLESHHLERFQMTTDLLFIKAFRDLHCGMDDANTSTVIFARRSLLALTDALPNDDRLAEYHLSFELRYFPTDSPKAAKRILKKQTSSLRLYNACAMIEAQLGRSERAEKIWTGALKMKDSFPTRSQLHAILLVRNWVWNELKLGHAERALSLLLSYESDSIGLTSSTNEGISSAALLRITRAFKDGFDHALSQSQSQLVSLNSECLALLAYTSQTDGLQAAVETIHEHCASVSRTTPTNTLALELLHQAKVGILAHHVRQKHPYKPAFVRSELEASIKAFPNNTIFLDLYRENEKRFRINDRVRSILKDEVIARGQSPMIGWSSAIDQEISRYVDQASGSTAESVRATFNRALLSTGSAVRHSKFLWTKWLQFEEHMLTKHIADSADRGGKQDIKLASQKLRDVFLTGLHHLPWAKDWVLHGLQTFDGENAFRWSMPELKGLFNVLVEKELRVRLDGLEDLLDDLADGR